MKCPLCEASFYDAYVNTATAATTIATTISTAWSITDPYTDLARHVLARHDCIARMSEETGCLPAVAICLVCRRWFQNDAELGSHWRKFGGLDQHIMEKALEL